MIKVELNSMYDSRKSFYNKAYIVKYDDMNVEALESYGTEVAIFNTKERYVSVRELPKHLYSNTTIRHIREFLKQNGFNADMTKKELLKEYAGVIL